MEWGIIEINVVANRNPALAYLLCMHQKANLSVALSTAIIYAWGHFTHISTVVLFAGLNDSDTTLRASLKC